MTFVYVFALPWFLFAIAYGAYRGMLALFLMIVGRLRQKKKDP